MIYTEQVLSNILNSLSLSVLELGNAAAASSMLWL
jgi:hypothetical protein